MEKFIDSLLKIGLEYGEVVSVPDFESVRAEIPEITNALRSEDGYYIPKELACQGVTYTVKTFFEDEDGIAWLVPGNPDFEALRGARRASGCKIELTVA